MFKKLFVAVMAVSMMSSAVFAFGDVNEMHENGSAINYGLSEGLFAGYADGTFKPDNRINRAEFTKILTLSMVSAEEVESCERGAMGFSDVKETDWFAKHICVAKKMNWVQGYPDGSFRPADEINFVEMAKMVVASRDGVMQAKEGEDWFKPYVENLAGKGAVPDSVEGFTHKVKRGEMAEVVYRVRGNVTDKPSKSFAHLKGEKEYVRKAYDEAKGMKPNMDKPAMKEKEKMKEEEMKKEEKMKEEMVKADEFMMSLEEFGKELEYDLSSDGLGEEDDYLFEKLEEVL